MTDEPQDAPPAPALDARRATLLGVIAILLGAWTGCGGCSGALGALGTDGEAPPPSLFSGDQAAAMADLAQAAAAWAPIDGALGFGAAIAGVALLIAGVTSIARLDRSGVALRVAFVVSAALDGAQLLWMFAWFLLLWGPFTTYTVSIARTAGSGDVDPAAIVDVAMGFVILLGVLYYVVKIGVAALCATLARPPEPVDDVATTEAWAD